jgi:hypothetical protein
MQAGEFLRLLWGNVASSPEIPGLVTIWRTSDKKSLHYPVSALTDPFEPDEDEELFELFGRENLYVHPGLRREGLDVTQRGGKKDVVALGAFVLDIDVASPQGAHKAKNEVLPKGEDDVLDILAVAPELPSVVVMSGYGYQPWWVLDPPLWIKSDADRARVTRAYEKFEEPFLRRAKELGFHMDSTATLDHQFRLPGTFNAKRKGMRA